MAEQTVRVLLIDDDSSTFDLTRELFDERYPGRFAFDWAGSFDDGLAAIRQARHDVCLVDHRIGGQRGVELVAAVAAECQAPLIVTSEHENHELDVAALRAGAADYLVRDVRDVAHLEHAIRYALQQHRLLTELEQERDLLRALMENLPDSIYFKDAASRFLRISKSKALRSGLKDAADAVGKTDFDFFKPDDAQASFTDEQEIMRMGRAIVGKEEMHVWPDGRTSWVATSKLPLRDKQGHVIGTFGISHDITEQKLALQALRDSEFRTRMIVETALDAFIAMDHEGAIIDWNAQAEATFGWAEREVLGRPLVEVIIPPQFHAAHKTGLGRYLHTRQAKILGQRLELTALHRDGHEFPVEITISALHLDDRRLENGDRSLEGRHESVPLDRALQSHDSVVFAAFIHDITKRKAAEAALRDAKEAAEAANRSKSDFLANMSHEIRTPMNAILGMTELVLDTPLADAQREYLLTVRESGDALLRVINDILDFSKIEAGKLDLIPDVFSLREILGDAMKSLAVRAHREQLELAFRVAANVPDTLVGDAGRLRQIVVNLVGNAIKFTPRGEVVLDVSQDDGAASLQLDGAIVTPTIVLHFYVRDTGIGIATEKQALIFEAFEQADTSTTRRYGGTGLGLAISQRLVKLMGGRIWVDSELGIGSTFHFTTTFVVSPVPLEPVAARTVVMHGTRVLIVDDNATNRLILEEMLSNWGLEPVCAASARQALEQLQLAAQDGRPFSIVLSDLHMPDADGFMLAKSIRDQPTLTRTMLLMLTSGDRQGDTAKCRELGISAYLFKPIKQSELFNALVATLGVNGVEDHATPTPAAALEQLPPMRILLAEDSLANQKLAVGLLTKWGHQVTVANNGAEALRAWAEPPEGRPFDVVLMDVQMPEMDGFEATAAIRDRESAFGGLGRHTPIIAMTAHAMKGDRERCLDAGMDGYIAKPIRQHEVVAVLRSAIGGLVGETGLFRLTAEKDALAPVDADSKIITAAAERRLNWNRALRFVANDQDLLREVLAAFVEECPDLQARLRQAADSEDWLTVAKTSHTLQAALRLFGGDVLDLAVALEDRCKRGQTDESRVLFEKFSGELENVLAEVQGYLKGS